MFLLPMQPLPGAPSVQPPESSGLLDIGTGFRDMLQTAQQQLDADGTSPLPDRSMLEDLVADLADDGSSGGEDTPKKIVSVLVPSDASVTSSGPNVPTLGGNVLTTSEAEGVLPEDVDLSHHTGISQKEMKNTPQRKMPLTPLPIMSLSETGDDVSDPQIRQVVQSVPSDQTPQTLVPQERSIGATNREEMLMPTASDGSRESAVTDSQPSQDEQPAVAQTPKPVLTQAGGVNGARQEVESGDSENQKVVFEPEKEDGVQHHSKNQDLSNQNPVIPRISDVQSGTLPNDLVQVDKPVDDGVEMQPSIAPSSQSPYGVSQERGSEDMQIPDAVVQASDEQSQTEIKVSQPNDLVSGGLQSQPQNDPSVVSQTGPPGVSVRPSGEPVEAELETPRPNGAVSGGLQSQPQNEPSVVSQTGSPVVSVRPSGETVEVEQETPRPNGAVSGGLQSQPQNDPSVVSQTGPPVVSVRPSGEPVQKEGETVEVELETPRPNGAVSGGLQSQPQRDPSVVSQTGSPVVSVRPSGEPVQKEGEPVEAELETPRPNGAVSGGLQSQPQNDPSVVSQTGPPVVSVRPSGEPVEVEQETPRPNGAVSGGLQSQPQNDPSVVSQTGPPVVSVRPSGETVEVEQETSRPNGAVSGGLQSQPQRDPSVVSQQPSSVAPKQSVISEPTLVSHQERIVPSPLIGNRQDAVPGLQNVVAQQQVSQAQVEHPVVANSVTPQGALRQGQASLINQVVNESVPPTDGVNPQTGSLANVSDLQPQVLVDASQRQEITPQTSVFQTPSGSRQNRILPNAVVKEAMVSENVDLESDILPKLPSGLRDLQNVPQSQGVTSTETVVQPMGSTGALENVKGDQAVVIEQSMPRAQGVQAQQTSENQIQTPLGLSTSGEASVVSPVPQETQTTNPVRPTLSQEAQQFVQREVVIENKASETPMVSPSQQSVVRDAAVVSQVIASDRVVSRSADRPVQDVSTTSETAEPNLFVAPESQMNDNTSNREQYTPSRQPVVAPTVGTEQPVAFNEVVESEMLLPNVEQSVDVETQSIDRIPGRSEMRVDTMPRTGAATDVSDRQLETMPSEDIDRNYRVGEQVIRSARVLTRGGASEVTMRLDPQELGAVTVRLSTEGQVVSGEILVENQKVQEIVQRNLGALRDALASQGIQIENIDVSVNDRGAQADREAFRDDLEERSNGRESREQERSDSGREQQARQQKQAPDGQVDYMA